MRELRQQVRVAVLALCGLWVASETVGAAEASDPGRQLLERARQLEDTTRAWKDRSQRLRLVIRDGRDNELQRELTMKTRRHAKGEDKTLTVFFSPPLVRGTAFLQHTRPGRDAEQWIYFPATEKIRQIESHGKDRSFVGTDFSFRDLELIEDVFDYSEEEAHARLLGREQSADDSQMSQVELTGASRDLGYKRIVLWLSEPDIILRRMELFQEEPEPAKVLVFERIRDIVGIPTAHRLEMRQPARRSSTSIDLEDVKYNSGLSDDLFTDRTLEHALDEVE